MTIINLMNNFLLKETFRVNLNEAILLAEIEVNLKVTLISANTITSFKFLPKLLLMR